MKLRKLKLLEKAYDSVYDLNSEMGYKFSNMLSELEQEAKEYGYKFKLSPSDKFKLYVMNKADFERSKKCKKD